MTLWQQIILFCLMICGNLIIVSTSTVLNRRHIISKYMHKELKKSKTMKMIAEDIEEKEKQQSHVRRWFGMHAQNKDDLESTRLGNTTGFEKSAHTRIHTGMIQRVDGPAIHINPTGQQTTVVGTQEDMSDPTSGASEPAKPIAASSVDNRLAEGPLHNISHHDSLTHSSAPGPRHLHENGLGFTETPNDRMNDQVFSERPILTSQTEIQNGVSDHYDMEEPDAEKNEEVQGLRRRHRKGWRRSLQKLPRDTLNRTMTKNMESGIGQFPSIFDLISTLMDMTRTKKKFTIPRVRTMATTHTMQELGPTEEVRMAPYLSFDAIVTGNSHFHGLTKAQRSELGGVEYRALTLLAWLIPTYWITWVGLCIVLTAPYLASDAGAQYRAGLQQQDKPPRNSTWFWIFNVVSAMTNTGMSLVDNSMNEPLAHGYMMLLPMIVLIIVGNTGFPLMLRFVIWVMSKCVDKSTRMFETLTFLLEHPRRCYLYLFPSGNSWVLLWVLFFLTILDWFLLMICDLDTRHAFASTGTWIAASLFQSVSTRTCGFQTFQVPKLAPAEQLTQIIMMYIAAFPIMLTMRTTNVYEDQSLFAQEPSAEDEEEIVSSKGQVVWGRFLSSHIRHQLAYDLWWLVVALWIVLMADRGRITSLDNPNLTVFGVIYEIISAYGNVGMSFGSATKAASLSGDFSVLSKLVIIGLMYRGRHRGLPNAIDRSVMLPHRMERYDEETTRRQNSLLAQDMHNRTMSLPRAPTHTSLRRPDPHAAKLHTMYQCQQNGLGSMEREGIHSHGTEI
ncbi:high-affinity potassium ion transmembrane transporter [Malassezia pachydermatis]